MKNLGKWKDAMLETGIDQLLEIVSERKSVSSETLSKELSVSNETIETWCEILSKENIISVDYDHLGKMLITNQINNVKEKEKKANTLKDEVGCEITSIELNINEESKKLDEEHHSIAKFESIIKKEQYDSKKLENILEELSKDENILKRRLTIIENKESKIKKDYDSINHVIKAKMGQIKETEENLKSFEKQKDRLFKDIEIIKRLSKAISKEHPADMADKIEKIEKNILEIRKQSRNINKKYSFVRKLMSKI